jgi:hypothetical protein
LPCLRPAAAEKNGQAEVFVLQARIRLVGTDVAGKYDHVGISGDVGNEIGIAFEVEVGKSWMRMAASISGSRRDHPDRIDVGNTYRVNL